MYQQRPVLPLVAILGFLILVPIGMIGCDSSETTDESDKPEPSAATPEANNPARHDSPQAAFDATKAARKTKDYKAFCDCLTPEFQDVMAAIVIQGALMMKEIASRGPENEEDRQDLEASIRALDAALARCGLNQDQLQAIQGMDLPAPSEESMVALAKLTTPIKDKPAFIEKIKNVMDAIGLAFMGGKNTNDTRDPHDGVWDGRLESIKREGDRATAVVVFTVAGKQQRVHIGFKTVNGSWLIDQMVPRRK